MAAVFCAPWTVICWRSADGRRVLVARAVGGYMRADESWELRRAELAAGGARRADACGARQ